MVSLEKLYLKYTRKIARSDTVIMLSRQTFGNRVLSVALAMNLNLFLMIQLQSYRFDSFEPN